MGGGLYCFSSRRSSSMNSFNLWLPRYFLSLCSVFSFPVVAVLIRHPWRSGSQNGHYCFNCRCWFMFIIYSLCLCLLPSYIALVFVYILSFFSVWVFCYYYFFTNGHLFNYLAFLTNTIPICCYFFLSLLSSLCISSPQVTVAIFMH